MNKSEFIAEVQKLNIVVTDKQMQQLDTYYKMLVEWNEKINLTAITLEEEVYLKHFYDSLSLYKAYPLNNQKLCDIGTGAGFPGIVLKIFFPSLQVTLVESLHKRCIFCLEVIKKLSLKDIVVVNERAEIYSRNNREKFDIVTSRAVANIKILFEYSVPLLKVNGYFLPMKASCLELEGLDSYLKRFSIKSLSPIKFYLPKENSERTIGVYQKLAVTHKKYPRPYSQIKKEINIKKNISQD